jgi:hypothetical protein
VSGFRNGRNGAAVSKEAKMARKETNSQTDGKAPTHGVFVVEGDGKDAYWTRIGAAWAHQDGEGFNVRLSALPVSGRLVVRANREGGE